MPSVQEDLNAGKAVMSWPNAAGMREALATIASSSKSHVLTKHFSFSYPHTFAGWIISGNDQVQS